VYPDARGRPIPLLRQASWLHTLPTYCTVLQMLSPGATLVAKGLELGNCWLVAAAMTPSWLAPAPARHVAFAVVGAGFTRYALWICGLLFKSMRDMQARARRALRGPCSAGRRRSGLRHRGRSVDLRPLAVSTSVALRRRTVCLRPVALVCSAPRRPACRAA
jgi:hypothetical protein